MTIDKSLRTRKSIVRARSVLTRAERIERLLQQDRWNEADGVFGLSKVRVYRVVVKKKKKKKGEEEGAESGSTTAASAKTGAIAKSSATSKTASTKSAPVKSSPAARRR